MKFAIYLLNTFQINIKDSNIEGKTVKSKQTLIKNITTSYYYTSSGCIYELKEVIFRNVFFKYQSCSKTFLFSFEKQQSDGHIIYSCKHLLIISQTYITLQKGSLMTYKKNHYLLLYNITYKQSKYFLIDFIRLPQEKLSMKQLMEDKFHTLCLSYCDLPSWFQI